MMMRLAAMIETAGARLACDAHFATCACTSTQPCPQARILQTALGRAFWAWTAAAHRRP
jgi:hypothetical protein